jgi:polysaccharide pyruvyl transferase WcaK-like protein
MKFLVLHGSSANFGDTAMLEGVVLNLARNLPAADLYVAERPGLQTNVWASPRVHRQTIPNLIFPGEHVLAELPIAFNKIDSDDRSGERLLDLMKHPELRRIDSDQLTAGLVRGLLGKAFGAIGVSYHFCTFALSQGVPAVCLYAGDYYSQKARGICAFWQDDGLAIFLQKAEISSAVEHVSTLLRDLPWRTKLRQQARSAANDWQKVFDKRVRANLEYQQPLIARLHEKVELPARSDP